MTTHVPSPVFGDKGFVPQNESAILAGVQADQQDAFGGDLNPALSTPQGQLAQSEAAIIGEVVNQFLFLANGVDPAYASGRMQDAIGRIYFIERNPAQPTVVIATCTGLSGTIIPANARAQDKNGILYFCSSGGTIPISGTIDLAFFCSVTGPVACPTGFLNIIYQAIPGWDSINNTPAGVEGSDVESRADFEHRRQQSVAFNAQGSLPSVIGAVLQVPGILDAYATENVTSVTSGAVFNGTSVGTTLTVNSVTSGTVAVGQTLTGAGVAQSTVIAALGSGTGGTGTYVISISQNVGPETMNSAVGGAPLVAHSLYIAAYGGDAQAIANAIWTKKSPGCNYNGNTTKTVLDTRSAYSPPYPSYSVTFEIPTPTAIKFAVSMQNNSGVPSNAADLVKQAVIASFVGADGGPRARIGSWLFASRFYANIAALGPWALIYEILLGVGAANQFTVLMQINQVPTIQASDIAVTFS